MTNDSHNRLSRFSAKARALWDSERVQHVRRSPWTPYVLTALVAFILGAWLFSGGNAPSGGDGHNHAGEAEQASVWTCSMHPQIRMPGPGQCPICGMDLIPLVSGGSDGAGPRELAMSATARRLADVETTLVEEKYVHVRVPMFGKVQPDERKVAEITARFPGRLERLFVDFTGTLVKKGDHLAMIYSPELLTAQSALITAYKRVSGGKETGFMAQSARGALDAARDRLQLWGLTDKQIGEIEKSTEPSDTVQIDAPIGGIVIEKLVQEGEYVKEGTPMFRIAELSSVWVMLDAYEKDLPWLRYGQSVEFTSESYPGKVFEGKIAFISPVLDPKTRTVKVRVNVPNPDLLLKPGMFVRGVASAEAAENGVVLDSSLKGKWISPMHPEIVKDGPGQCDICGMDLVPASELGFLQADGGKAKRPLVVPASAVLMTGRRAVVYVEKPSDDQKESVFEGRQVVLGPRAGDNYIIESGLQPGERVVTRGNFKIDSALQIQAKPSMMSMQGGPIDETLAVSSEFEHSLEPVYAAYLKIQQALSEDKFQMASDSTDELLAALEKVNADTLPEKSFAAWNKIEGPLQATTLQATSAQDIDALRTSFEPISNAIIDLVSRFGHEGDSVLAMAHCPMAFGNKGANWLQEGQKITNPYFGQGMLTCGSVEKTFPGRHEAHASAATQPAPNGADSSTSVASAPVERAALEPVYASYLAIQEALAGDDQTKAKEAFTKLGQSVEKVDMGVFKGDAHQAWMTEAKKIQDAAKAASKASDLAGVRQAFEKASQAVLALLDRFGHGGKEVLSKAHCPMAFDNKGADWMQVKGPVHNPYFGASMLGCGELKKEFAPADAN